MRPRAPAASLARFPRRARGQSIAEFALVFPILFFLLIAIPRFRKSRAEAQRLNAGQSLLEFALVLPIIFVLLITIGDFGRYFATGVTIESAARAAAEVAAQEYNRELATAGVTPDYSVVHRAGWSSICDESKGLANMTYAGSSVECDGIPTIVCVHDGADTGCGNVYNAAGGLAASCASFDPGVSPTNAHAGGGEPSTYVEVRVCYRFNTFFNMTLPFLGGSASPLSGEWIIERTRMFTVADY